MKIVSIFIQPHAIVNFIWQIYIKKNHCLPFLLISAWH